MNKLNNVYTSDYWEINCFKNVAVNTTLHVLYINKRINSKN